MSYAKAVTLASAVAITVATAASGGSSFSLKIMQYDYSLAYHWVFNLRDQELTITFAGETEAEKPIQIAQIPVSEAGWGHLRELVDGIDLDSLQARYEDPSVADGFQVRLEIQQSTGASKTTHLANRQPSEVMPLIDAVNRLVPRIGR